MKLFSTLITVTTILLLQSCTKNNENIHPEETPTNTSDVWRITKEPIELNISQQNMFFIDANTGFISGLNGKILKTTDAGTNWNKLETNTTLHLSFIYFTDEKNGFVSGQEMGGCLDEDCDKGAVLLKTIDGGETWTKIFFEEYSVISSLHFYTPEEGVAIIYPRGNVDIKDAQFAKTYDGGKTWKLQELAIRPTYGVFQCIGNNIFIIGNNQTILKSKDKGENWETLKTPVKVSNNIRNLSFYDGDVGYIDGVEVFFKTINGGQTWDTLKAPFSSFDLIHFYNENEVFNIEKQYTYTEAGCFPSATSSIVHFSSNGGQTWESSEKTDDFILGLYHFPHKDLGYSYAGGYLYSIRREN